MGKQKKPSGISRAITPSPSIKKKEEMKPKQEEIRRSLADDVAKFLSKGGKVEEIPRGVSKGTYAVSHNYSTGGDW